MTSRNKHDAWPSQWIIVNRKDHRILASAETGRLCAYATRYDARAALRRQMERWALKVLRVRLSC